MTTCEAVATVLARYRNTPRSQLPGFLLNPNNENEWNLAFAVAGSAKGIHPVCEGGILVGWQGAGWRCREKRTEPHPWTLN